GACVARCMRGAPARRISGSRPRGHCMAARHGARAAGAAVIASAIAMAVQASEPLWEAGIGVAALGLPDYRGSDQSRFYAFPLPYFVYRGEIVKADRQGLRGIFFKTDRIDLNMSVGA